MKLLSDDAINAIADAYAKDVGPGPLLEVSARAAVLNAVDHPPHYNAHPSGVECITVTEHMNFNLGNAVKYIWRAGLKSEEAITDLEKARWYVEREIARLKKATDDAAHPASLTSPKRGKGSDALNQPSEKAS